MFFSPFVSYQRVDNLHFHVSTSWHFLLTEILPPIQVSPDVKLPILYLIDSIVKNVGVKYKQLFAQNIVNMFCGVFEKVKVDNVAWLRRTSELT